MPNTISASRVFKIPEFRGSLSTRALYIYLPAGYDDNPALDYPILYMHDGQNIFDAFVADCFAGYSWQAAKTADNLITKQKIRPFIIVGIANGAEDRTKEYLPHYATLAEKGNLRFSPPLVGAADKTMAYYLDEIDPYIRSQYRVRPGRENTATCGSSMGGLLSQYFAWEKPAFAKHHAILSPAYWLTQNDAGENVMLQRILNTPRPDVRLWLDSGVEDVIGNGDDGMYLTIEMRDALQSIGFSEGDKFKYILDEEGIHHETTWARRLPDIFRFLFPA